MKRIFVAIISVVLCMCILYTTVPIVTALEFDTSSQRNTEASISKDMTISGTNSFGNMIAQSLDQATTEKEENGGYNVFSVEVSGKIATVSYEALSEATLVVAVYDESAVKMLATGKSDVKKGEGTTYISIDIDTMPDFFYVKAYIVEPVTLRPLCTAFSCPTYTREMQELLAMSTDDFDQNRVLNLDESTNNNFAVYDENTKVIEQNGATNKVTTADEANQIFVIENADSTVTSLQPGDIFAQPQSDGNVLIVKVATITVDGTTTTIIGEETDLDEVFEFVKIDGEAGLKDAEIDPSTCGDGVTYDGLDIPQTPSSGPIASGVSIEGSTGATMKFKFGETGSDTFKISGGVNIS